MCLSRSGILLSEALCPRSLRYYCTVQVRKQLPGVNARPKQQPHTVTSSISWLVIQVSIMSPWTIPNGMPSVQRYRPAIYLLTAITAAFAIYYIHDAATSTSHPVNQAPGLHRSNAQRRRRTRGLGGNEQASVAGTRVSTSFLGNEEDNARIYG